MRCQVCDKKVGLAAVCPYCGSRVRPADSQQEAEKNREKRTGPQGGFRGRLDPDDDGRTSSARAASTWLGALLSFMADPATPRSARWVFVAAVLYILSPIDFVPGGLIPVIGWIDDLIVGWLAWQFLRPHIQRHKR